MAKRKEGNRYTDIYDDLIPLTDEFQADPEAEPKAESDIGRDIRKNYPIELLELWELDPRDDRTQKQIEDMAEWLADGQDELVKVRPHPDLEKRAAGFMQILGGGTRREGAALRGWTGLDIEVKHDLENDADALDYAWRNNGKRNQMSPFSHAKYVLNRGKLEPGGTQSDASIRAVSRATGYSSTRIHQYLDLLSLSPEIQATMRRISLNEKHGRALLMLDGQLQEWLVGAIESNELSGNDSVKFAESLNLLKDHADLQTRLLREIERDSLSANDTVKLARKLLDDEQKDADAAAGGGGLFGGDGGGSGSGQRGNHDDADFKDDNYKPKSKAQKAGKGGVGGTAPSAKGSGFASSDPAGQSLKRGPRQAPSVPHAAIEQDIRAITNFYESGSKVPANFDIEVDLLMETLEAELAALKTARASKRGKVGA